MSWLLERGGSTRQTAKTVVLEKHSLCDSE